MNELVKKYGVTAIKEVVEYLLNYESDALVMIYCLDQVDKERSLNERTHKN